MPYLVNGQCVPEELIRQQEQRIGGDPEWNAITDEAERARRVRAAAEGLAIDHILVAQAAARDPRPIDPAAIQREMNRRKELTGSRAAWDDRLVRLQAEHQIRFERAVREMTAGAAKPSPEEIEAFYQANRENFRTPDLFHAAHIVKHVNGAQSEEQARAGIEAALAEVERGEPFSEVAERYSDCKGNGGDLGQFPAGYMAPEFEDAIRTLEPGQRTGIFATRLGFHIAQVGAKTAGGAANFADVREDIERVFARMYEHEAYLRAVAQLRSGADIRWEPAPSPVYSQAAP